MRGQTSRPKLSTEQLREKQAAHAIPTKKLRAEGTDKNYELMLRYWNEYKNRMESPDMVPDVIGMKGMLTMIAYEQEGMIDEYLSLNTLHQYAIRFGTVCKEMLKVEMPKESLLEVKNWLDTKLKDELKLRNRGRPKLTANDNDLDDILFFLWAEDQFSFQPDESVRTKVALFILVLIFTSQRPGAVVVSDAYRKSLQAIAYKDLQFAIHINPDTGEIERSLTLQFNYMKGDVGVEDEFLRLTLWEDLAYPHLCPIALFISIAYQHGAFEVALEKLFPVSMQDNIFHVRFKDSVLDQPLFLNAAGDGPWTYAGAYTLFTRLLWRAGYICLISLYVLRRAAINILDKTVTQAEKGKICGHKSPKILQMKYLKDHVDVSLQSLFKGGPASTNRSKPLHGIAIKRAPGAPYHIRNTPMYEQVKQAPELTALYRELQDLKEGNAATDIVRKVEAKIKYKIECLRRIETNLLRDQWFKDRNARFLSSETSNDKKQHDDWHLTPARAKVVKYLYNEVDQSLEQRIRLIHSLLSLIGSKSKRGGKRRQDSVEQKPTDEEYVEQEPVPVEQEHVEELELMSADEAHTVQEDTACEVLEWIIPSTEEELNQGPTEHIREASTACETKLLKWTIPSSTAEEELRKSMTKCIKRNLCLFKGCPQSKHPFGSKRTLRCHYKEVHPKDRIRCPIKECSRNQRPLVSAGAFLRHLREGHHLRLGMSTRI